PARERLAVVVRVAVAQEVPGRVDEGVHRLRLALAGAAAGRTGDVQPRLVRGQRRLALRAVVVHLGQQHGQLVVRHGGDAAVLAVDNRDRAAPVALAREAPVAQAEADRGPAAAALAQPLDDRLLTLFDGHPAELRRVDQRAGLLVDHWHNRQLEPLREHTVAL